MTQEEKAKAYDEAIAKMKEIITMDNNPTSPKEIGEYLFPELQESEDERIRKNLIELFHDTVSNDEIFSDYGLNKTEVLAWLEKQGEQKSAKNVEPKFKVGDIIKPKDNGHEPWQIMQVDILDKKYRFKDGYVIHFSQEDDYELVEKKELKKIEQKKDMRNKLTDFKCSLKHIMEEAIECGDTHNLDADADMLLRLVQNPAWSEEDERRKNTIIHAIHGAGNITPIDGELAEKWLKSLKDRVGCEVDFTTTWKPSDEQIKVCKKVYADILSAKGFDLGTVNSELNRLEEELKKLREEQV